MEKLMNDVENLVEESDLVDAIDSKPYTLIGVAVGVGLTTVGVMAYKKVLKPLGKRIKDKIAEKKLSKDTEELDEEI